MANAQTPTLLPLDYWCELLGINPFEFNGISTGLPEIMLRGCEYVFNQHAWQKDFISREEIARVISIAENQIATLLSYWPAPKEITNEYAKYPQGFNGAYNQNRISTPRFDNVPVQLEWQKICSTGVYTETVLAANATITYSDSDGDGIDDTFTVSVATTETDTDNILVYVPSDERFGNTARSTRWQIRPITVTISAGTATITGHKAQCVVPSLLEAYDFSPIDVTNIANFLEDLEIVQRTIDTTTPITAYWNADRLNNSSASVSVSDSVVSGGYEHLKGFVRPNLVNCSTANGRGGPDSIKVNYIAGIPLENGRMNRYFAEMVTYLSVALLASEECGCERSNRIIRHWRMYPSDGRSDARPLTQQEINENPFKNARRGALMAWQLIDNLTEDFANV